MQNYPISQPLQYTIISTDSHWMLLHNYSDNIVCSQLGFKVFKLIHAKDDVQIGVRFSFGYIALYFARKMLQQINKKGIIQQAEPTLHELKSLIYGNIKSLQEKNKSKSCIAALLNENIACLKLIKTFLCAINDQVAFVEKHMLVKNLTSLLFYHYCSCIENNWLSISEEYSCKKSHDFLGSFLKEIIQIRHFCFNPALNGNITELDEIVFGVLELTKAKQFQSLEINKKTGYFQIFALEYFLDEKVILTNSLCKQLLEISEAEYIDLKFQKDRDNLLNEIVSKNLVQLLVKIANFHSNWSIILIKSLLDKLLRVLSDSDSKGLLWLFNAFYCIFSGNAYNSTHFLQLISSDSLELSINLPINKNLIEAFILENGIIKLIETVIQRDCLKVSSMNILEKGILLLLSFPPLCDNINGNAKFVQQLFEYPTYLPNNCQHIIIAIFRKCMMAVRLNRAPANYKEKVSYLPMLILNFICEAITIPNKIPDYFAIILSFYDILIEFFTFKLEEMHLESHKCLIFQSKSWEPLRKIIEMQKYHTHM